MSNPDMDEVFENGTEEDILEMNDELIEELGIDGAIDIYIDHFGS